MQLKEQKPKQVTENPEDMDDDVSTVIDKDVIINNQAEQLRDQQKIIEDLTQDVKTLHDAFAAKKESKVMPSPQSGKIPDFLSPHPQHLKYLEGLRMKCNGDPGGVCLSSCTTMHILYTKDRSERKRVNRRSC